MLSPSSEPTRDAPCVRNCCLGDDDVCAGCGRHLDEILRWHAASSAERDQILALAQQRRSARQASRHP